MHKLVINLPNRIDRKNEFMRQCGWLEDYRFLHAVNGHEITHAQMQKNEFAVKHTWRDPFKNRRITKGEVGCFLSHYQAWQKVIELNETTIIFEDDILIDRWDWKENEYHEWMDEYGIDLLYLGHNENEPASKKPGANEYLVKPAYPYNAHAYMLTPKMASELVESGFHRKIIPTDEILAGKVETHNVQALKICVANQQSRDKLGSDIEPYSHDDWFQDFEVHALTVGTDRKKCAPLNDSAALQGFTVKNLGTNVDWHGTNMEGPGGGHKLNLVKDYLAELPNDDIVLFTDAYDVFFTNNLQEIVKRYLDASVEILIAAESECWPQESMWSHHPDPNMFKYKYLNSGTYIGRVAALKNFFAEAIKDDDDDQLYMQRIWLDDTTKYSIGLDYEQYIFQTHEPEVIVENELWNPVSHTVPCLYHGNGGAEAKEKFDDLWKQVKDKYSAGLPKALPQVTSPMFIPHTGKIDILEKDMIVVDFMTQSQCERLIEMGDNHGEWAPLPEDKFPAYEIRVKELGFWDELSKHWQEHVVPIVDKYWKPIEMYGMRDAFIMRYSVDTQKSLALHNDASLVTGSVKLNDDYKGASLVYPRQGVNNDDVPCGKMILFPGMVTHGHECTELLEGTKYSFTMWTSRYPGDVN